MAKEKDTSLIMKIIPSAVAVVCTAAICITGAVCTNKAVKNESCTQEAPVAVAASDENANAYLTEAEAAAYIGLDEAHMAVMRKNLKKFEGAYIRYSYEKDGEEKEIVMYQKDKLDEAVAKTMGETSSVNFKYLDQAIKNQETAKAAK